MLKNPVNTTAKLPLNLCSRYKSLEMTSKEYQELMKGKSEQPEPKREKLSTREALRAMAEYFDLDTKSVNFWIRQMELNGKI